MEIDINHKINQTLPFKTLYTYLSIAGDGAASTTLPPITEDQSPSSSNGSLSNLSPSVLAGLTPSFVSVPFGK